MDNETRESQRKLTIRRCRLSRAEIKTGPWANSTSFGKLKDLQLFSSQSLDSLDSVLAKATFIE